MATRISVVLEDDLDGGPAAETVRFRVGGAEYEIDLNDLNASEFREALAPYVQHARRERRRQSGRTVSSRQRSSTIRAWAKGQGITVSERGRIPASVVEQYEAAAKGP
jgi:hypothetical protein